LFDEFRKNPLLEPFLQQARTLMATRDKALRDVIHEAMEPYVKSLSAEEYERFCREHAEFI